MQGNLPMKKNALLPEWWRWRESFFRLTSFAHVFIALAISFFAEIISFMVEAAGIEPASEDIAT